jgi:hypothetical protein
VLDVRRPHGGQHITLKEGFHEARSFSLRTVPRHPVRADHGHRSRPVYGRFEIGHSDLKLSVDGLSADDTDTAYGVRVGHYFHPSFAVEGFYSILGDRSLEGVSFDMDAVGMGVVGKKNFGADDAGFFIAGRAGAQSVNTKLSVDGLHLRERSTKPYVGIGVG